MKTPPLLEVQNLHKSYNNVEVLGGVDFTVRRGQVKALLGPSGSGKSTILRMISLLEPADSGTILLDGEPIGVIGGRVDVRPAPERVLARQRTAIGMVFQKFNLFPHLDATRNVMSGLTTVLKVPKKEARSRRWKCSTGSACPLARTRTPRSSPAASNSAWRLPAPW